MTIYKFPLQVTGKQVLSIPSRYQILSAQYRGEQLCLWIAVEEDAPYKDVEIEIIGTGHQIDVLIPRSFIATVQSPSGMFVWHVFEVLQKETDAT